jgi:hypothetical protein
MAFNLTSIGTPNLRHSSRRNAVHGLLRATAAFGLMICATISIAEAQSAQQACRADFQSVCSGVQPGGGRVVACLKQNYSKLSPDCQAALAKQMPRG